MVAGAFRKTGYGSHSHGAARAGDRFDAQRAGVQASLARRSAGAPGAAASALATRSSDATRAPGVRRRSGLAASASGPRRRSGLAASAARARPTASLAARAPGPRCQSSLAAHRAAPLACRATVARDRAVRLHHGIAVAAVHADDHRDRSRDQRRQQIATDGTTPMPG